MALIGRIRKHFWFVLLLLGLALASFVIMDMVNGGNKGGAGPKQIVGEVAGQKIDYMDFQKVEQALYSNSSDNFAAKSSVWNYLVEKALLTKQADNIGLGVSTDELLDMEFGSNLSPIIQNTFRNPQTGQVDMQRLLNIKQAIENGDELNASFRLMWSEQEKQIKKTAIQEKLTSMVSKAMFTPSYMVEATEKNGSSSVSFDYVKVSFDQLEDSEVNLTDEDITAYINENTLEYTNDTEKRLIAYAVKDVYPTAADSAKWMTQVSGIVSEYGKKSADQDSLYTINNQGVISPVYSSVDNLSGSLKDVATTMQVGDVHGPYEDAGYYFAAKLLSKSIIPDSVSARHILRSVANGDPAQLVAANLFIDSIKTVIQSGANTMETLAPTASQDPGTSFKGGELGTFAQGAMVPAFNKAAFVGSKEGGLYKVATQFGVHLIQVDKRIFNTRDSKYKFGYIRIPITPSQETQDNVFDEISDIVDEARDIASLTKAIEGRSDMTLETAPAVAPNDYVFDAFGSGNTSRDIIKWAYDKDVEIGEVSPSIYTYTDKVNYFNSKYVIAALKSVSSPGLASVETVRDRVEIAATKWKKANILAGKISGTDLNAIASQYGTSVESASNIKFNASTITSIGNEPNVLASAFGQSEGGVSAPIKGNNGVYIVRTTTKTEGTVPTSIPTVRKSITNTSRSRASFSLMNALKKLYKTEDNRSKFF